MMKKVLGIIGGMGPLATADLFRKIVLLEDAERDCDHIRVCIDSNTAIPDRTEAILHGGPSPVREMVRSALRLECMGADALLIPCNTAHYFYDEVSAMVNVPILNMIRETASEAKRRGFGTVGLIATDGTIQSGVYGRVLEEEGILAVSPDEEDQAAVMDMMYGGIKAGKVISPEPFRRAVADLRNAGAETLILGCTEAPLAFEQYGLSDPNIDPAVILAKAAIRFAGGRVRGE